MSSIPTTMRAWQVRELGEVADVLVQADVPVPEPGPGQVLIEVWSSALNFPDVLLARGTYQEKPPLPFTPGLELCGLVVATGAGVPPHTVGERVIGTVALPHGSLARYALAAADEVFPAPPGLDDTHASALHIAYQTAWFGLYRRAALRAGETVLIHAASGGVGSAAVQLAKIAGARVVGVVGTARKAEEARRLGCDTVIDRSALDEGPRALADAVKQVVGPRGVDVVFDPVGGDAYAASTMSIGFEGRIVVVGFAGGTVPAPSLGHVLVKNYTVLGLHWGLYRSAAPELVRRCHDELNRLVGTGVLRPLVSERVAFEDAASALQRLGEGQTVGRIAVIPPI